MHYICYIILLSVYYTYQSVNLFLQCLQKWEKPPKDTLKQIFISKKRVKSPLYKYTSDLTYKTDSLFYIRLQSTE